MALISSNSSNPYNIPPHVITNHPYRGVNASIEPTSWIPEDAEVEDIGELKKLIDKAFDEKYPKFEPEIIHTFDKDYFLPALKVLRWSNGQHFSPAREALWIDGELMARCDKEYDYAEASVGLNHKAPDEDCDCGIYGSVNLEEIRDYITEAQARYAHYGFIMDDIEAVEVNGKMELRVTAKHNTFARLQKTFSLCIVEPMPDAKVLLCRKGWKASHVFISEIIGETMSLSDASSLLSIAWNRPLDLRRLEYESR